MSWRLEDRDLTGTWRLTDRDLQVVWDSLQNAGFCDLLSLKHSDDFNTLLMNKGEQWVTQWRRHRPETINPYLGERLEAVRRLIPIDTANVDLGTDHAHLPISAVRSGVSPCAIGIDIAMSPLLAARTSVERASLIGKVGLLRGDGLKPLYGDSVEIEWISSLNTESQVRWGDLISARRVSVSICGVGGALASEMIRSLPPWVCTVVIQANDQPTAVDDEIRRLASQEQFRLTANRVTIDKRRLFITKRIDRKLSPTLLDESYMLWLWRWVELSRVARRVARTPLGHSSLVEKNKKLSDAIGGFISAL